ncbi:MAG TPA: PRC-barrel domain-containing protein [Blastocatellia bacterium]|nr:PRC-barrel domain-containing protein [Blastocatellia bacterium]
MNIELGQKVRCRDKEVGTISHVILDAESYDLNQFVVNTGITGTERLVPMVLIDEISDNVVNMSVDSAEFDQLAPFNENEYRSLSALDEESRLRAGEHFGMDSAVWGAGYYIPFTPVAPTISSSSEFAPPEPTGIGGNERPISKGMNVVTSDEHKIGKVKELTYDPSDKRLESLEIESGVLFTSKQSIPADWISDISKEGIRLNRTEDQIKQLSPNR